MEILTKKDIKFIKTFIEKDPTMKLILACELKQIILKTKNEEIKNIFIKIIDIL